MLANDNFFYCYSLKVQRFLTEKGLRYLCVGLHPVSGKKFFQYEKSEELSAALLEWASEGITAGYAGKK